MIQRRIGMKANRFSWIQGLLTLTIVLVLVLGSVSPAQAAEIIPGEIIPAGTTIDDDALIGGTTVIVDGTVNGNLIAGGETVTLNGIVNGDAILMGKTVIVSQSAQINGNLFLGAQTAEVSGKVSGSLFGGAAAVELRNGADVAGNVYAGAYSFESLPETSIGRDLLVGAYQVKLAGDLTRNLKGGGAAFDLNGSIGGDATIDLGNALESKNGMPAGWNNYGQNLPEPAQPGLRFGPDSVIQGKLNYTSTVEEQIGIQPQGGVVYSTPTPEQHTYQYQKPENTTHPVLTWTWKLLRNLITGLILGALALWLVPGLLKRSAGIAGSKTLPALGIGFLAVVLSVPVVLMASGLVVVLALLFGLATLGGLSGMIVWMGFTLITVAIIAFTFVAIYGSKLIVAFLVGKLLFEKVFKAENVSVWVQFFVGIFLLTLLIAIPFIGWLFGLVVMLIGLGVVWYLLRRQPVAETAVVGQ
jgi:cytoskeletal protein CcmA (bactofilin family)